MTMLKKVGLAAYNAVENGFRRHDPNKEDIQDYLNAKIEFIGRAVIGAMREPTEWMKSAGCNKLWGDDRITDPMADGIVEDVWPAMIDAILAEQPEEKKG
jgi:hypothetical protein